jgi:hypothetical protein
MTRSRVWMLFAVVMTVGAAANAQTTPYQLFGPVFTRPSLSTTSPSSPAAFGTTTLTLSCGPSPTGIISSSQTPISGVFAKVFTDNFIGLTVGSGTQVNICTSGDNDIPSSGGTDCFNNNYPSVFLGLNGQDPDNFVATYGVPALDISSELAPLASATGQVKFALTDLGTSLGSSSVYLITNCTQKGVAPGGNISGNPITPGAQNPGLTPSFNFDSAQNQRVEFSSDYTAAINTLAPNSPTSFVPQVTNSGIPPSEWSKIVHGTSFATTSCVPDIGELDANGNPLCVFSTILCTNNGNSSDSSIPKGDNCPQSTEKNVQMFHTFDALSTTFTPPPTGLLPHGTGIGFLMGSDTWPTQSCVFEGPETGVICPQNPLTSFLGDFRSGSGGNTTNSTFVVVAGVPLPHTLALFLPNRFGWSNSKTVNLNFLTAPAFVPPFNNNGFVAAAIQTLTYGIDDAPLPVDTSLPISGDVTLPKTNPVTCPGVPTPGAQPVLNTDTVTLTEGSHLLHYFATDCAGTEELVFTPQGTGAWTSFKTVTINVDTTPPSASGISLPGSGTYSLKQNVSASFSCMDPSGFEGAAPSGVVFCGPQGALPFAPKANTGTLTLKLNTSSTGTKTLTVNVVDLAGNVGTPVSVNYTVVK